MAKILGIGIATLDIINYVADYPVEDSEIRSTGQKITRGGNITNTLTVLSQLNHECFWAGTLADEPDAETIKKDLKRYSINTRYIQVHSNGKVPTSYIVLNEKNGSRSIVHYRDLPELTFEHFKTIPLDQFNWIHFEGRNIAQTKLMLTHLNEYKTVIASSIEFEKYRDGIEDLYPLSNTLIFSKDYCLTVSGNDPEAFLEELHTTYPNKTMILAWGDKGSYGINKDQGIVFKPAIKQPNVVDTIGAGDTFNAGVIDSFVNRKSLIETLDASNKIAAYKISVSGFDISNYV